MAKTKPFDEHPARYEQWFADYRYVYASELKAVGYLVPALGKGIEIGVGSGRFAGVAEALPLKNETYDFALMVTTICFVDDPEASFREIFRILRKGGPIIVGFADRESLPGKTYESRKQNSVFYRPATFFSTEEILILLRKCGFELPRIVQTVFGRISEIKEVQDYKEDYGAGGFVAVRAEKRPDR